MFIIVYVEIFYDIVKFCKEWLDGESDFRNDCFFGEIISLVKYVVVGVKICKVWVILD